MLGIGQHVIGGARNAGRAGHASQAEDGHALDVHRQAHAVHQPRINGRAGNAGDGNEEERAQILGGKSRARQRAAERLLPEVLRHFDPMIVGRAPAREPVIFFDRQSQVPRLDAHASLQALQEHRVIHLGAPMFLQRLQQHALVVFMRGNALATPAMFINGAQLLEGILVELSQLLRVQPVVREFVRQRA